jgi:hypothetical protein
MKAIGSRLFFAGTMVLFVLQATWLAISSRFPMAFDEDFHWGLIKLHAQQWSPVFSRQPPGQARYGALVTDPSFLYHWLMSFPYRLVTALTDNQMAQVISLRLINVALFALGLWLFWLVLSKTRASATIINIAMLFFVLTPVVILLAAHVNYDNLLFPLIAGSLLLLLRFREQLLEKRRLDSRALLGLGSIMCLASLVKYPYLPIMTGITAYVLYLLWRVRGRRPGKQRIKLWAALRKDWQRVPVWQKTTLLVLAVISVGLFTRTYGMDIARYHNPVPQCGQVLNVARCQTYGPWARNYYAAQHKMNAPNFFYFAANWPAGMFLRLFFVINGSSGPDHYANYIAPIMAGVAAIGGIIGLGLFARHGRRLLSHDRVLAILLIIMIWYIMALWGRNYHDYIQLGRMVAVNGRYFVMVILPFYLSAGLGWQQYLASKTQRFKAVLLSATIVLFLQGGGIISFLAYSNGYWYWIDSPIVLRGNQQAHNLVKHVVWAPKII